MSLSKCHVFASLLVVLKCLLLLSFLLLLFILSLLTLFKNKCIAFIDSFLPFARNMVVIITFRLNGADK